MMRVRSQIADKLINLFASSASVLSVGKVVERKELLRKYDYKLYTYDDKLAPFAISVIPALLAMACIFVVYRALEGFEEEGLEGKGQH